MKVVDFPQGDSREKQLTLKEKILRHAQTIINQRNLEEVAVLVDESDGIVTEVKICFSRAGYRLSLDDFPNGHIIGTKLSSGVRIIDGDSLANGIIRLSINPFDASDHNVPMDVGVILNLLSA
jgi:hypothetical protein